MPLFAAEFSLLPWQILDITPRELEEIYMYIESVNET